MLIQEMIAVLEAYAPPVFQESFDNAGLLVGSTDKACTGVMIALDATEEVIEEAVANGCNLVVAYHPIIFKALRQITGKTYVERAVMRAIRNDVSIYAIHTNLDNVSNGMNAKIASVLGLTELNPLAPRKGLLRKLFVFVPVGHADAVRQALFDAGAGHIGNYASCSFNGAGMGTYLPGEGAQPFLGEVGTLRQEPEIKVEVIFPAHLERAVLGAMLGAHPYEEVAYDLVTLENSWQGVGTGWMGVLAKAVSEDAFLSILKDRFGLSVIRHSPLLGRPVRTVAVCGGSGSFLTPLAIAAGADWLVTADVRYHEFFGAEGQVVLADIGHFESEQFTPILIYDILREKFRNFALFVSKVRTNPVRYFI